MPQCAKILVVDDDRLVLATDTHGRADSRLSYGQFNGPGVYETTVSRPELFRTYLVDQLEVILRNYDAPIRLPNGDILIPRRPGAPPPPEMRTPEENLPPSPDGEKPGIDL